MIALHKAILPTGGGIGDEITSGTVGDLLPKITTAQLFSGATISKKFYLKNNNTRAEDIIFSMTDASPFTTIIFQGTGAGQLEGDLFGNETHELPLSFTMAVGEEKSFWVQITVPPSSVETANYQTVYTKLNY